MIDGSSAENPMRMTKFAAHAKMSRSHTSTYEGMEALAARPGSHIVAISLDGLLVPREAIAWPIRNNQVSPWRRPLRVDVECIQRLARGHEEAVALGSSEAQIAADLGQSDAADELAFRCPDGHATVAEGTAARCAVARHPDIAVDVTASAVRAALDAVDHEIAEQVRTRQLVVGADVEHVHVALAAWARVARSWTRADDVQLFVIGREHEAVWIGELVFADDKGESPAGIHAVHAGRQLSLHVSDFRRLAEPGLTLTRPVARPAGRVGRAFVELTPVRRIGEPVAAVGIRDNVVRRVEALAVVRVRDDRHRAVVLVADDAAGQMFARELAALKVERVAVAVVRRAAEDGNASVVFKPAQLPVVGNVAPDQVTPLTAPGRSLRPQSARPEPLDRRVALSKAVEHRIDGDDIRIDVGHRWCAGCVLARRPGDGARRLGGSAGRRLGHRVGGERRGAGDRPDRLHEPPPRYAVAAFECATL